jgi:hypothetical protein
MVKRGSSAPAFLTGAVVRKQKQCIVYGYMRSASLVVILFIVALAALLVASQAAFDGESIVGRVLLGW